MKIAFISDIHSNYFYFKKVMLQIEKSNVDEIYCLGDMIGYYDKPDKVTELIINKNIKCIKGNHEKYLLGEIGYNKKNENIYRIENQRRTLSKENLNFLQSLPDSIEKKIDNKKFYLTHSLPNNTTSYIRSIHDLDSINSKNYDYYCFGHTHIPLISFHYGLCVLNPGSIGQPRDYTQKPSFIIVNTENQSCELYKVDIGISSYINQLKKMDYPEPLIRILIRGEYEGIGN